MGDHACIAYIRLQLLKKVARELELDIAKMARLGEPYGESSLS